MIILYLYQSKVVKIEKEESTIAFDNKLSIAIILNEIAAKYPKEILIWCDQSVSNILNKDGLYNLFHQYKLMLSYNPDVNYLSSNIGFVDESPFINLNKSVRYGTWQMSSLVGMVHASILIEAQSFPKDTDFNYYLNSLAKVLMPHGLLCYSEPKLLTNLAKMPNVKTSNFTLFKFVKQHYKTRWLFLLLLNLFLYKRQFAILPFLFSLFYKNRTNTNIDLDNIKVLSSIKSVDKTTVDVIIPTIGRKKYLYDVLLDLKAQTHPIEKVIIVEQNPDSTSKSELDYLQTEDWPFKIYHTFTHQAGACNARNIALTEIKSRFIFFADDDIRFDVKLLSETINIMRNMDINAVSLRCYQEGQKQQYKNIFQWGSFGSGCSIVSASILQDCKFDMGFEFGFGEDGDFGMQLRNYGHDVLYVPEPSILHLKAPMGGFRTKPILAWHKDVIRPKPSPTVMLYKIKHDLEEQILSYKTTLFFKFYKHQKIKNPFKYYITFQKQWKQSVFWANELKLKSN